MTEKIDKFSGGRWKTQHHSGIFVTRFIYSSKDFEENTTMSCIEDRLVFQLNGEERSLYLATDIIQKRLTINHGILFSMGVCPIKNKYVYELHHTYLDWANEFNDSFRKPTSIESIWPFVKQIESRQGALIDLSSELERAFCDNEDEFERLLNEERFPKEAIFNLLVNSERQYDCYQQLSVYNKISNFKD